MMSKINLVIQVQGEQYFPAVKHKADYAYVGQLAINAPEPVENTKERGETLHDIIHLLEEDKKQLVQSFEQYRKAILSTREDEELTPELFRARLLDLYIKHLSQSNNTVSVAALAQSNGQPVIAGVPQKEQQATTEMLASALADWITTKQVDADDIFEALEKRSTVTLGGQGF